MTSDVLGRNCMGAAYRASPEGGKARAVWAPWQPPEIKRHSRERIGRTGSSLDDGMNNKSSQERGPVLWGKKIGPVWSVF